MGFLSLLRAPILFKGFLALLLLKAFFSELSLSSLRVPIFFEGCFKGLLSCLRVPILSLRAFLGVPILVKGSYPF